MSLDIGYGHWANLYCLNIKDDPEIRKYIKVRRENVVRFL